MKETLCCLDRICYMFAPKKSSHTSTTGRHDVQACSGGLQLSPSNSHYVNPKTSDVWGRAMSCRCTVRTRTRGTGGLDLFDSLSHKRYIVANPNLHRACFSCIPPPLVCFNQLFNALDPTEGVAGKSRRPTVFPSLMRTS